MEHAGGARAVQFDASARELMLLAIALPVIVGSTFVYLDSRFRTAPIEDRLVGALVVGLSLLSFAIVPLGPALLDTHQLDGFIDGASFLDKLWAISMAGSQAGVLVLMPATCCWRFSRSQALARATRAAATFHRTGCSSSCCAMGDGEGATAVASMARSNSSVFLARFVRERRTPGFCLRSAALTGALYVAFLAALTVAVRLLRVGEWHASLAEVAAPRAVVAAAASASLLNASVAAVPARGSELQLWPLLVRGPAVAAAHVYARMASPVVPATPLVSTPAAAPPAPSSSLGLAAVWLGSDVLLGAAAQLEEWVWQGLPPWLLLLRLSDLFALLGYGAAVGATWIGLTHAVDALLLGDTTLFLAVLRRATVTTRRLGLPLALAGPESQPAKEQARALINARTPEAAALAAARLCLEAPHGRQPPPRRGAARPAGDGDPRISPFGGLPSTRVLLAVASARLRRRIDALLATMVMVRLTAAVRMGHASARSGVPDPANPSVVAHAAQQSESLRGQALLARARELLSDQASAASALYAAARSQTDAPHRSHNDHRAWAARLSVEAAPVRAALALDDARGASVSASAEVGSRPGLMPTRRSPTGRQSRTRSQSVLSDVSEAAASHDSSASSTASADEGSAPEQAAAEPAGQSRWKERGGPAGAEDSGALQWGGEASGAPPAGLGRSDRQSSPASVRCAASEEAGAIAAASEGEGEAADGGAAGDGALCLPPVLDGLAAGDIHGFVVPPLPAPCDGLGPQAAAGAAGEHQQGVRGAASDQEAPPTPADTAAATAAAAAGGSTAAGPASAPPVSPGVWEAAADASGRAGASGRTHPGSAAPGSAAPGSAARPQSFPCLSRSARATGLWDILASQSRSPTLRSALLADDLSDGSQDADERSAEGSTSLLSLPGARRAWDTAAAAVMALPANDSEGTARSGSGLRRRRGWSSGPIWADTTVVFKPLLMVDDSMLDGERKPSSVIRNRRIQEIRQSRRQARSSASRSSMGEADASPSTEAPDPRARLRADSSGAVPAHPWRASPLAGEHRGRDALAPRLPEPVPSPSPARHTGLPAPSLARSAAHSRSRSAPHTRGPQAVLRFRARWALMAAALLERHGLHSPRQLQSVPRFPPLGQKQQQQQQQQQQHQQQQQQASGVASNHPISAGTLAAAAPSLATGRPRRGSAERKPGGCCWWAWARCAGAGRPSSSGFRRLLQSELAAEAAAGSDPNDPLRAALARAALLEAVQHTLATLGPASRCRSLGHTAARLTAAWVVVAGAGLLGLRALLSGIVLCSLMLPGSALDILLAIAPRFGDWAPRPLAAWSDFAGLLLATALLLLGADRARQIVGDTVDSALALAAGAADASAHLVSGCKRAWAMAEPAAGGIRPPSGGSPALATPGAGSAGASSAGSRPRRPRSPDAAAGRALGGCGSGLTTWRLLGRLVLLSAIALVWPALATWTGAQASGRAAASFAAHVVHLPMLSSPAVAAVMALLYGAIMAATALREAQRIAAACCAGGCERCATAPVAAKPATPAAPAPAKAVSARHRQTGPDASAAGVGERVLE